MCEPVNLECLGVSAVSVCSWKKIHVDVRGTEAGLCGSVCICVSDHMSGS